MPDTNLWLWVLSLARVLNTHDKREGAGAASEMRSIHTQFTRRPTSPDDDPNLFSTSDDHHSTPFERNQKRISDSESPKRGDKGGLNSNCNG